MPKKNVDVKRWLDTDHVAMKEHEFISATNTNAKSNHLPFLKPDTPFWSHRVPKIDASVYDKYLKNKKRQLEADLQWNYDLIDAMEKEARRRGQSVDAAFSFNPAFMANYRTYRENIDRLNRQLKVLAMAQNRTSN